MLELKRAFTHGTTHVLFKPEDFIARLAALVPRPRAHLLRYHGLFAPNAPGCRLIVKSSPTKLTHPQNTAVAPSHGADTVPAILRQQAAYFSYPLGIIDVQYAQ